jgi:LEA14-like dessication related protein
MQSARYLIVTILCLGLGACAVQRPTVDLHDVRLKGLTLSNVNVALDVSVQNPNTFELPVKALDWELDLYGDQFAVGQATVGQNIPAQGSSRIAVPLSIPYDRAFTSAAKLLKGRDIAYELLGTLTFNTPIGDLPVAFTHKGSWGNPLKLGQWKNPGPEVTAAAAAHGYAWRED